MLYPIFFFAAIGFGASLFGGFVMATDWVDRRRRAQIEAAERKAFEARPRARILVIGHLVSNDLLRPWPEGWKFDEAEREPNYTVSSNGHVLFGGYTRRELAEISARRKEFE